MALEDMVKLRVMNYNILHGFHSPDNPPFNPPFELNEERLRAAQEAVKREDPDILVLTEACFGGEGYDGIRMVFHTMLMLRVLVNGAMLCFQNFQLKIFKIKQKVKELM